MPGNIVTQNTAVAPAWVPRTTPPVVAGAETALPGRTVEVDQPQAPRNPIVRALFSFGKLLTRCFTSAPSNGARKLTPEERAAQKNRTDVAALFRHLVPAKPSAAADPKAGKKVAEDVRRLIATATAAATAGGTAGTAQFDQQLEHAVVDVLDSQWPGEQALALADALQLKNLANAVNGFASRSTADPLLILDQIRETVGRVIRERAFATMDRELGRTLDKVRANSLPVSIRKQAEKAMSTAAAVYSQLHKHHLLPSPASPEQLASILQTRLATLGAAPDQLQTILSAFSPSSLKMLVADPPADIEVATAVRHEIQERIPRLMKHFDQEVNTNATGVGRRRAETVLTATLESDIQRMHLLHEEIISHHTEFGIPLPENFRVLAERIDQQMAGFATANVRPTGKGTELRLAAKTAGKLLNKGNTEDIEKLVAQQVEAQKKRVDSAVVSVLDTLFAKEPTARAATYLNDCKILVNAVQDYMVAAGVPPADAARPDKIAIELQKFVATRLEGYRGRSQEMLQALGTPEMRALKQVLLDAADKANGAGLPELHTDLKQLNAALEVVGEGIAKAAGGKLTPRGAAPQVLDPKTRFLLEEMCSVRIDNNGHVMLTAGLCGAELTEKMRESVETPYSEAELTMVTLHGVRLPEQFKKDAERDGTVYLGPDGEPLIDRRGWSTLTESQRHERIARGYSQLLQFYEGNEFQTEAIVRLANQSTTAGILIANHLARDDSPLRLEGYGPGQFAAASLNSDQRTVMRFSRNEEDRPQMELSYEHRGGRYTLLDQDGIASDDTVFLDYYRSRAKFTLTVEAGVQQDRLHLVGTPTYDVHLVRSPIQRAFRIPTPDDLLQADASPIYRAMRSHAERTDQQGASNFLGAMEKIVKWQREPDQVKHAQRVYTEHLAANAPYPLPDTPGTRVVRQHVENLRTQTVHIFDVAVDAARQRLNESGSPLSSEESNEISQFLAAVEDFKANEGRLIEDARAIMAAYLLPQQPEGSSISSSSSNPVRAATRPPAVVLPAEVVASTRSAADAASRLVDHEIRDALNELLEKDLKPLAKLIMPEMTADLRAQAAEDPSPVPISI